MSEKRDGERNSLKRRPGVHFLQIPGPSNVPERVLRAIDRATIDHRGPVFKKLAHNVLNGLREVFQTHGPVIVYPGSGTGAWEAALVNTLSPGDRLLMFDNGYFASKWFALAQSLGLSPVLLPSDSRHPPDASLLEAALRDDTDHQIKAVCVIHNETSTGVVSPVQEFRGAIDRAAHPALFMVDTVSSLACIPYYHDDWGVDVSISSSQKGLMLPPGLSFNAVSERAMNASARAGLPRGYWDWRPMIEANVSGTFPYTPATNLIFGLREALEMLSEEGLDQVFARHARLAAATRAAVAAWGLDLWSKDPRAHSDVVTAVVMPNGFNADDLRGLILENYNMSLGSGLGPLAGKVFRIGHLGDLNELTLIGTLAGVELGLKAGGVPRSGSGVSSAIESLS